MQEIVSPGVYSQEQDLSFIPPGQQAVGLAIIGPTEKGAAFIPTDVTSYSDFVAKFGTGTSETYTPQAAYMYLQTGNTIKIVRILGAGGWLFNSTKQLVAIASGSTILTVFHPSKNANGTSATLNASTITGSYANFTLTLSGSSINKAVSASLTPTDNRYLLKVIGSDQNFETGSAFPFMNFSNYFTGSITSSNDATLITSSTAITFTSSNAEGYDHGKTPWILSDAGVRLFRVHHISDGFATNTDVKISLTGISKNTDPTVFSTFNVVVRAANDIDKSQTVVEQYIGVSLDSSAPNYIANVIGDKYKSYSSTLEQVIENGNYNNKSKYIRIEVDPSVEAGSINPNVIPNGFEAVYEPIAGFTGYSLPSASLVYSSTSSTTVYSGFDFANSDNWNYLKPIPSEASTGSNVIFVKPVNDDKFTVPFQGGTDGMSYAVIKKIGTEIASDGTNVFGFDLSSTSTAGYASFQKAIDILSNPEAYSFNILVIPGVIEQYHSDVTAYAEAMVEGRGDAIYIRDLTGYNETVATAIDQTAGIDSSYSATYYPWVKVKDIGSNKIILVPPSVVVPQAYAYNDKIAATWYAPAGVNRGGLGGVVDTHYRLFTNDRNSLYKNRINPITKFNNTGIIIWGQKTLQVRDSALNRINVRRLVIEAKGVIGNMSLPYVFEQNDNPTRIALANKINPYLESIKQRHGLYSYRVQIDESVNTNDVIDRNELIVNIFLSPTRSIEFILLTFSVSPTGTVFQ